MKYRALVTDYDGTIAHNGVVDDATLAALHRARGSGLRMVLVTGRELPSLFATFDHPETFDRIVAENGAVVHDPATGSTEVIGMPPPPQLLECLRRQNVPVSVGHSVVATMWPYEPQVREAIRALGLPWHVVVNKDAVMALPANVTKATGLRRALDELGIAASDSVGVGDAENDDEFLRECGLAVAVANALPAIKATAGLVTKGERGRGVQELVARLLACR